LTHRAPRRIATMKGSHRLPDFSVVVWIKKERTLPSFAIRSARCRRGGTVRNDRVSTHGRFPLGNQQCGRRAQTCRGIEGRLSATRSCSAADNKPRGRCGVDLDKGRTHYQALDSSSLRRFKSGGASSYGAGVASPSRAVELFYFGRREDPIVDTDVFYGAVKIAARYSGNAVACPCSDIEGKNLAIEAEVCFVDCNTPSA
jgi:hypothetical protein